MSFEEILEQAEEAYLKFDRQSGGKGVFVM